MLSQLSDFLQRLGAARGPREVHAALASFGSAFGFEESVLARFRPDPATAQLRPAEFAASDPEGVRRYVRLIAHDPVAGFMHRLRHPKLVHVERLFRIKPTPEQEPLWSDPYVRRASIRVCLPATEAGTGGGSWSVVFGATHGARDRREVDAALPMLWLAAAAAGARVAADEVQDAAPEVALTPRERECLLRLAQGDRVDRIAERLGLSNATVELHLAKARRRLGARTSAEAVARAVMGRLIQP